jgi:uncharacterized protein (TIGR03790 family)
MRRASALLACWLASTPAGALDRSQVALIVNVSDPLSVQIGDYYAAQRRILFQNVIRVAFPAGKPALSQQEFAALRAKIDSQVAPRIQAYALAWAAPYRVDCVSITSAFAFGFDPALCAEGCKPTRRSPYYDSASRLPFAQHRIRPAMAIAATSFDNAKALIDRGIESDASHPAGGAYLLSTSDAHRNVRSSSYALAGKLLQRRLTVHTLEQDALIGAKDVLFYFIGKDDVRHLDSLHFLPGAIADHLTSAGGELTGSSQMSALRWLEAGATGSFGTVVEPCNLPGKFPHPALVAKYYLKGETLIEAYWKSVSMPGQGIFIGEPLAAPFRRAPPRR